MKKIIRKAGFIVATLGIFLMGNGQMIANATGWYESDEGWGKNLKNKVENVETIGTDDANNTEADILTTIQSAINRVLGMLSFVALILCLWGGFQMLTAGGDDSKVKSGTKILKNAGLGLAVIGLSWLVVSFVFRIVNKTSGAA